MRKIRDNKGFSILITIIVVVLLAGLGVMGLSILTTETQMSVDTMTSAQAFFIAEGGLQYYFEQLQNQSASWATPPAAPSGKALGNGTFTITTANATADEIDVTSTANVTGLDGGTTIRIATAHFSRGAGGWVACSYAIYVSGNYTPGAVVDPQYIMTGATIFPSVVYEYYSDQANLVGQRVVGNKTFTPGTYSGIWYVTGTVTIRDNVTINGTIISEGTINANNRSNITINPTLPNPALVGTSIGFPNTSNLYIRGVVYSTNGNTSINSASNSTVFGKILTQGGNLTTSGSGTLTITYDSGLKDNLPPGFSGGGGTGTGGMSIWREI